MLEKRKSPRSKMVLPVKVWIDNDTHLAHTIDIAPTGARLDAAGYGRGPEAVIGIMAAIR